MIIISGMLDINENNRLRHVVYMNAHIVKVCTTLTNIKKKYWYARFRISIKSSTPLHCCIRRVWRINSFNVNNAICLWQIALLTLNELKCCEDMRPRDHRLHYSSKTIMWKWIDYGKVCCEQITEDCFLVEYVKNQHVEIINMWN